MLTDTKLKSLKPQAKAYKVADRDGLYVVVSPKGAVTFRLDYRFNGRRETLTIGRYGADAMSLAEAREGLTAARKKIHDGISPAREKSDGKRESKDIGTFKTFAEIWLRDAGLADSTIAMRKSILERDVLPAFGNRLLEEITPSQIMGLCEKIKGRGAPATAVHAREVVQQVYRHAISRGLKIENPADAVKASAIATFKPRERALTPKEIRVFFNALDGVGTLPTLKLALRFILLTLCRKGELLQAKWPEIDFEAATWTVPAERMKARRPHVVYLSQQALDLLVGLKTCAGSSPYLLPGRYETGQPMSDATLNRVITATVEKARAAGEQISDFGPHDLRRTASTLLHEAGFNTDWIEKCLAHEQKGVRAVYNKAEYSAQRREMLQEWANMVDGWIAGAAVIPFRSQLSTTAA
jgi:integrase